MTQLEFKRIEAVWYKKLKEEGFQDIENQETKDLKKYSNNLFFKHSAKDIGVANKLAFVQRYYELAAQFVDSPEYEAIISQHPKYKRVWEMHIEGKSYPEIAKEIGVHKLTVRDFVKRIAKVMLESNKAA